MKKLKFYIIIPALVSLFMASCNQSENMEPLFPYEIPSEALPTLSYETPLDSVLSRSDRFLGQMFMETRSSSVNRQAEINTLYRSIGTLTRSGETEEIPVHIVNYTIDEDPAGYVILIGDERIDDVVVAYSNENNWVLGTIPAFEDIFLERLDNYIITTLSTAGHDDPIIGECQLEEWYEIVIEADKLIPMPAKWGQEDPYNMHLATCEHEHRLKMVTGCVATAMGQIMAYWKHPASGSYKSPITGETVTVPEYNWDDMTTHPYGKDLSPAGQDMVAHLMAEIGHKVNMNYGCFESGASFGDARDIFRQMGYSAIIPTMNSFSALTIIDDLKNNKPVFIRGGAFFMGHAWVVDGYQYTRTLYQSILTCESPTHEIEPEYTSYLIDSYYLSFNMGYEGNGDGYYKADLYAITDQKLHYRNNIYTITNIYH